MAGHNPSVRAGVAGSTEAVQTDSAKVTQPEEDALTPAATTCTNQGDVTSDIGQTREDTL